MTSFTARQSLLNERVPMTSAPSLFTLHPGNQNLRGIPRLLKLGFTNADDASQERAIQISLFWEGKGEGTAVFQYLFS